MTTFAAFLDDIRPLMPSATVMSVIRSGRRTARDFLKRTGAYMFDFTDADLSLSGKTLTFTLPDEAELSKLTVFKYGGSNINASSPRDMARNNVGMVYYVSGPDTVVLSMVPSAVLTGTAELSVAYNATGIPDGIFSRFYETLLNGVLADMYSMENTAWFDPTKAQLRGSQYELGVEQAAREISGDNVFKASRAQYHDI